MSIEETMTSLFTQLNILDNPLKLKLSTDLSSESRGLIGMLILRIRLISSLRLTNQNNKFSQKEFWLSFLTFF